ncbi:MAG: Peptidase family [Herbinix sp.]|nr:Peptidase family [Herbinix sp.]
MLVVILTILLSFEGIGIAYAATTDDLRVVIGERRVTDETLISDLKALIYKYRQTQYRNELIELLKEKGNLGYEDTFNRLIKEKEDRQDRLEECFSSNKPVDEVITKLSEVYANLSELGALKRPDTYILEVLEDDDQKRAYEYARSVMSCMEDDYDLGEIGEGLKPPTLDRFHLDKAFGQYREVLGEVSYLENDGVDLQVIKDNTMVVSQFNGIITDIHKKGKKYSITIAHGPALKTIYRYLKKVQVKEGEEVKQYDVLGIAASDNIHFKVILNTISINPLFLYGGAGERVYSKWAAENPGMVVEATDFSGVKKYVEAMEEPQTNVVSSTVTDNGVETELKFEDGYIKPEVPVVDMDHYDRAN